MIQTWKIPHLMKGMLTYVPILNEWRLRRGSTGGTNTARYCYAVWLRHLVMLDRQGFNHRGASIGELGPGDSIGTGLAGLLSGANQYVGLDVIPYSATADLETIFNELAGMYLSEQPIPTHDEFPAVRPRLSSYGFPSELVRSENLGEMVSRIASDLSLGMNKGKYIKYHAPWTSVDVVAADSLDLIFSQGVLQCVDDLQETYRAMFAWLKPGGYSSHSIGCAGIYLSPHWNGHWAYTDLEWKLVRGRRAFLLNRASVKTHTSLARRAGFEVLSLERDYATGGLPVGALAARFQALDGEDLRTRGIMMVLRKPE